MAKDSLLINHGSAEANASNISKAGSYFYKKNLSTSDDTTTLSANIKAKQAFNTSQNLVNTFGDFIENDAKNIRKIDAAFTSVDTTMGTMINQNLTK